MVEQLFVLLGTDIFAFCPCGGSCGFFNLGRLMLWAALGAFAGAKTMRLLEVCFLMKETDTATRVYLAAVNLALGCGACWLLADLVLKHSGL